MSWGGTHDSVFQLDKKKTALQSRGNSSSAVTQEVLAWESERQMMLSPVAGELHRGTNLSLRQVLIRSQEKGGEKRLRRPQVGEEAIGAEEEGRVDRLHAQLAQHDLHQRGHAAEYHPTTGAPASCFFAAGNSGWLSPQCIRERPPQVRRRLCVRRQETSYWLWYANKFVFIRKKSKHQSRVSLRSGCY